MSYLGRGWRRKSGLCSSPKRCRQVPFSYVTGSWLITTKACHEMSCWDSGERGSGSFLGHLLPSSICGVSGKPGGCVSRSEGPKVAAAAPGRAAETQGGPRQTLSWRRTQHRGREVWRRILMAQADDSTSPSPDLRSRVPQKGPRVKCPWCDMPCKHPHVLPQL